MKVFISTVPFSDHDRRPLCLLSEAGVDAIINPLGRKLKEHICIEITASDEAFGVFDQTKIQRLPSSQFEGFGAVEPGMLLEFSLPDGEGVAGCVTEVAESEITVDFNHPLIGRDCIYEMDLVGFVNSTKEQTHE